MDTRFDLDTFLAQPRLGGLALAPDGSRAVVGAQTPAPDGKRFRTALWLVDPGGEVAPRQLTRSAPGESAAAFLPDGSLLFVSARPDPDSSDEGDPPAGLWRLPAHGGEARLVVAPPGGVSGVEVAADTGDVVISAPLHPGASTFAEDAARAEARKDAGVGAQLFDDYPMRFWDHHLGPREAARWFIPAARLTDDPERPRVRRPRVTSDEATDTPGGTTGGTSSDAAAADEVATLFARGAGVTLTGGSLTPDGLGYVTAWGRWADTPQRTTPAVMGEDLVVLDPRTGERRTLVADGRAWGTPRVSPDGTTVVAPVSTIGVPERSERTGLALVDLASGAVTDLELDVDVWPGNPRWLPDGSAVVIEADHEGHRLLFLVPLGDTTGTITTTRLTGAGAHSEIALAADGEWLLTVHSGILTPPRPVRYATDAADQTPTTLRTPVGDAPADVRVERLVATADDGVEIGSWLVLPTDVDGPVPLVTFIHGGPRGSWNAWHWRWCAAVVAERGYAVLLPDPAISTGYGQDFHDRGWGRWSERPYTDVLCAVDAAVAHEAVDGGRLAAMGGSFGGYMANWIAGHDDRFRCIVTHASLWNLPAFHGTTDIGLYWETEFGSPYEDASRYVDHSPHRAVGDITTPMLVIHGELDYRVPISEALMLWTDLKRNAVDARFLYFPDENHWVLKPQNARLWYETVLAFLAEHLDGVPFERPELL